MGEISKDSGNLRRFLPLRRCERYLTSDGRKFGFTNSFGYNNLHCARQKPFPLRLARPARIVFLRLQADHIH
jgi:hypothetical protein